MPQAANIVLADAQATPVNHTFVPVGRDLNGVWWFEDQSASAVIGYNRISVDLVRPANPSQGANSGQRINRAKIGIHTPKLETLGNNSAGLTPPPTVAYILRKNEEYIMPERCSSQDRKDLNKYGYLLPQNTLIKNVIEDLQAFYG